MSERDGGSYEGADNNTESEMNVETEMDTEVTTETTENDEISFEAPAPETEQNAEEELTAETKGGLTEADIEADPNVQKETDPGLTEKEQAALEKPADERNWRETEHADAARNSDFQAQKSYATNPETGAVLRDKDGNLVECAPNEKGSVRPDLIKNSDNGIEIRENKNYTNVNNLMQNIKHQSEQRKANFGEDVQQTYVVAPKMSVEDAARLQDYVENKLGVNLEFQHK